LENWYNNSEDLGVDGSMDLREIVLECVDWVYIAQSMVQWPAVVSHIDELSASVEGGEFFDRLNNCWLLRKYFPVELVMPVEVSETAAFANEMCVRWCVAQRGQMTCFSAGVRLS
jgi:hypothetical protein